MSIAIREPAISPVSRPKDASDRPYADAVDVLRIVRSRWSLFRNVCLGAIAFVLVVAYLWPARYSSSAVVMVEPRRNNVTDQTSVLSETPTDPASIQDQIQLLTSRDLAASVVKKLGLDRDPEFAGSQSPLNPFARFAPRRTGEAHEDALVSAFLKNLSVDALGLSTTIAVTYSARSPEKAALIANTVVDTYLESGAAANFDVTRRTTDWLLARIGELEQQVQAEEAGVQRYKADNNLNDTAGGSIADQQLAAISAQLVSAREDLAAKEAENQRVASLLKNGRTADVSQIVSSPLIVELREQQAAVIRDEAQLETVYGPKHPKLQAAESQRRDLDAKIGEEVGRLAGTAQNDASVARAQVRSLEESLQRAETEAAAENMARVKLQSLQAEAASTRSMYEAFVSRLRETQGTLQMVDARVISHAPIPNAPSSPPRLLMAAASVPAGLLLGLLAVLLAERLNVPAAPDNRVRTPQPAPDPFRGVPVLVELPLASAAQVPELTADQPASAGARAMRTLAHRVAADGPVPPPKIVAVTSMDAREGQTSVALGLARASAQLGRRVIVMDGNLRAPRVAHRAGLPPAPAALAEVLGGAARLSQSWQRDLRSAALLISGPPRGASPHDLWKSPAMARLDAYLRKACDLVIVDAAPISPGNELPLIAKHCDAVIVVAGWNGAPRPALSAALDHLREVTALPIGIVLTR